MYGRVLSLCLLSIAQAAELTPHEPNAAPVDKGLPKPTVTYSPEPEDMTKYCFFGEYPSGSCRFHCYMKKLSAFCDEEGVCQCKEENQMPLQNTQPSSNSGVFNSLQNSTQEEEAVPHLMFYILNLTPFSTENNMTAPPTTAKPLPTTARSWTSPSVLVVLVLVILTVLVLLEIVVCCKRRHTKLINIRPVLTPPACEKAPIGENKTFK